MPLGNLERSGGLSVGKLGLAGLALYGADSSIRKPSPTLLERLTDTGRGRYDLLNLELLCGNFF